MKHSRTVVIAALSVFLLAPAAHAKKPRAGEWVQIGNDGEWKTTQAVATLDGKLYTADESGKLFVADPATGKWEQLGTDSTWKTKLLVPAGDKVYALEKAGTWYEVNPADGAYKQVGKTGEWKTTKSAVSYKGKIYVCDKGGKMLVLDPATGKGEQFGEETTWNSRFMFAAGKFLYTIEGDGTMYQVTPKNAKWKRVGRAYEWAATKTGAVVGDKIYTRDEDGRLYILTPTTGKWKQLGSETSWKSRFMFGCQGNLYTIEPDGSMFKVFIK